MFSMEEEHPVAAYMIDYEMPVDSAPGMLADSTPKAPRASIPDHPVTAFLDELPDISYDDVAAPADPIVSFYAQHPEQFQNARSAIVRTGLAAPNNVGELSSMMSNPAVRSALRAEVVRRGYGASVQ